MTQRFAVNGVELAWNEQGEGPGPTLVLCHGFTGSSLDFSLQVEALAEGRRVVTVDQRGHGESTKTGDLSTYNIEQLADDLIAFLEAVGRGPVDLLGHSMGGRVVLSVVLARPDLVNSLILMDTSAWSFIPPDEGVRQLVFDFMTNFDPARGMAPTMTLGSPEEKMIEAITPEVWRKEKEISFAGTDPYAFKALGTELLAEGVLSVRDRLPEIVCPTTVLVGSEDHPLVDQAPELAAELAHGHLSVIEGAYHSPQLTHADEWRDAIATHLAHSHGSIS
jgi:pimeloyl-ACP methyl ester carboxylesterase